MTRVAVFFFETPCIMSCQQMGRVKKKVDNEPWGLPDALYRGGAARSQKKFQLRPVPILPTHP